MTVFYMLCTISLFWAVSWGIYVNIKSIWHSWNQRGKAEWLNVPCKMSKKACRRYPMARRNG